MDTKLDKILILDFGSQYTQLIARRVREASVYSEIYSWDVDASQIIEFKPKGIILSGGPESAFAEGSPRPLKRYLKWAYLFWVFVTVCRP